LTTEKALADKRKSVCALKLNPTTFRFLMIIFSNLAAIWEGIECKMEKSINIIENMDKFENSNHRGGAINETNTIARIGLN
jgi:hypothetical protein